MGGLAFNQTKWRSDCDAKGYSVGPIPSSALSSWSVFNASFTGNTVPLPKSTKSASVTGGILSTRTTARASGATLTASTSRSRLPGEGEPGITITLFGDPTGTKVIPLTTTTGTAPLQQVQLGAESSSAGNHYVAWTNLCLLGVLTLGRALNFGAL